MQKQVETWKAIPNYEGYYEASDLGRIRSVDRTVKILNSTMNLTGQLMALVSDSKSSGYLTVPLCKNGKLKLHRVHRLIAQTFLEPDDTRKYINHKDGAKKNNAATNLEWCTPSENSLHSLHTLGNLANRPDRHNEMAPHKKGVEKCSPDGQVLATYPSAWAADRDSGFPRGRVGKYARGESAPLENIVWRFTKQTNENQRPE